MVITIGANGDGVHHWCHYVHHHRSQWTAIGTIFVTIGVNGANGENPKLLGPFYQILLRDEI